MELETAGRHELAAAARSIYAELACRPAPESPIACQEIVQELGVAIDLGEAALATLVRVVDRSGEVRTWGYSGTVAWLTGRLGMRHGRAKERLTLARQLERLPLVGKLLRSGGLSYGHAATIAESVVRLPDEDCPAAEQILLEQVDEGCSAQQIHKLGQRITDVIAERDNTERPDEDTRRGYERSWLTITDAFDGGAWLKGWVAPELAALLRAALGPLSKPTGADDPRDHAQRTADALYTVLSGGGGHWQAMVIIDWETLVKSHTRPRDNDTPTSEDAPVSDGPPSPSDTPPPDDMPPAEDTPPSTTLHLRTKSGPRADAWRRPPGGGTAPG